MEEIFQWLTDHPLVLVFIGVGLLLSGQIPWTTLLTWLKSFFFKTPIEDEKVPDKDLSGVIKHWQILLEHVKDDPAALGAMQVVWRSLGKTPEGPTPPSVDPRKEGSQ